MDIPPLVLHKFTHIPLATLVLITDTLTVLLGVATYGFQAALVGIISVFLSSVAIDKMLTLGAIKSKNCMIISQRYEEMLSYIHQELYRGTDHLTGTWRVYTGKSSGHHGRRIEKAISFAGT